MKRPNPGVGAAAQRPIASSLRGSVPGDRKYSGVMLEAARSRSRLARARVTKLGRLARAPRLWRYVRSGVVPSLEHQGVRFRHRFALIIDVGASRGQFASFAADRFPDARIICLEPLEGPRSALVDALRDRVDVLPFAAGATPGVARLNVSAQDDSSSMLPIGRRQVAEFPGTQQATTRDVEVIALESILSADLPAPRLLKIDVQGFELEVLKGAGDSLGLFDEIFVECSFAELYQGQALAGEVVAYLVARGFALADVHGLARGSNGDALQADLLFRRQVAEPASGLSTDARSALC